MTRQDVATVLRGDGAELSLAAQPIFALEAGTVAGYELLARFSGPVSAPPDQWFAAARESGLAEQLTARVFTRLHDLRASLPPNVFCSVNVEPDLLLDDRVNEALHAGGHLRRVVVELTEHVRAIEPRPLQVRLDRIREAGGLVAIDDAGTGYAGLTQLLQVRPDLVKLDKALITGVDTDPARRVLVELVGTIADRMNAWVLAEGVETAEELAVLSGIGVPLAQGWLIGRPGPPWPTLDEAKRAELRALCERASSGRHVLGLVRSRRTRTSADRDLAEGDILLDDDGRPTHVVIRDSSGISSVPALRVEPSAEPAEVLRRAVARPAPHRAAPIVCTDESGRLLGALDIADLVDAALPPRPPPA